MDKCLEYFKAVISDPKRAEPWLEWWERNAETVRSHFPREDYLRLKFRKLEAARQILFDRGMLDENELDYCSPNFGDTHCHFCGQELFWAIPGETTPDQIVASARKIGDEQIERDRWIHPGVYCPNGCVFVMHHYVLPTNWNSPREDATNNPMNPSGGSGGS
ncbi:MAG: hypothetical protein KDA47_03365 [Planctomycetales bacterium]|nr:hypothetical protein [Planctomycetales bacterium]